ncbi:MAG: nitrous oxide reductase accessory protein NosL [Phycisphaeraceae bacterium]|nr:nitrous oxide reductase accessory protein NosL [Phycisphaeraceae bacterium]
MNRAPTRSTSITAATLVAFGLLASCCTGDPTGAPELRPGHDQCAECGMIINEGRFASALRVVKDGRAEDLLFDDIGCMLNFEREPDSPAATARFVHDHATGRWTDGNTAVYLMADRDRLSTPMGSGIVAFADRAAAERAARQHDGRLHDYPGIAAARKAWMEERYGKPPAGR